MASQTAVTADVSFAPTPTGRCYFLEIPIELRNVIYQHLTWTAIVSPPTEEDTVFLHEAPVRAMMLLSRQICEEYLDAVGPLMHLHILGIGQIKDHADFESSMRVAQSFTEMFRIDFPLQLLKRVRSFAVVIGWDMARYLPSYLQTEAWQIHQSLSRLRNQEEMEWTPSKGQFIHIVYDSLVLTRMKEVVMWFRTLLPQLKPHSHEKATMHLMVYLDSMPDIDDEALPEQQRKLAAVFHEPTMSTMETECDAWLPGAGKLHMGYYYATKLACDMKNENGLVDLAKDDDDNLRGPYVIWRMSRTDEPVNFLGYFPKALEIFDP